MSSFEKRFSEELTSLRGTEAEIVAYKAIAQKWFNYGHCDATYGLRTVLYQAIDEAVKADEPYQSLQQFVKHGRQ